MKGRIIFCGTAVALLLAASCAGPRAFRAGATIEGEFTTLNKDRFESKVKWQGYKQYFCEKLWKMMGDFPLSEGPLNEKEVSRADRSGYVLETVQFDSEPGETIKAYVLSPRGVKPPYQAVLCIHAEGQSKEDVAGEASASAGSIDVRTAFAKRLAEKGYLAVAIDLKGAGDRMAKDRFMGRPFDWNHASPEARREMALAQLDAAALEELLHGRTWMGRALWDIKRTIDYISTRKDVARDRAGFSSYTLKLGCIGCSLGGTVTAFAAAFDDRIRAAVCVSPFATFEATLPEGINGPLGLYVPGMLRYADLPDIVAMTAPRNLLIAGGKQDPLHPADGVQKAAAVAQKVYLLYGYPDNCSIQLDEGAQPLSDRSFQNAWAWFEKWL